MAPSKSQHAPTNSYPSWAPRFWHGMRTPVWWRLLARNRFRISPNRLHVALGVSCFTPINDFMSAMQWLIHEKQIRKTKITKAPIFILGHWRSGTTLLHELLVTDSQFESPNTFQCFAPSHFLLTEFLMIRFGNFLLPKKRPMDDMAAGWKLPQEDEFALMNLGVPTPYIRMAFPHTQARWLEYLSMENLTREQLEYWKKRFNWFVRALTYHYGGKQLVLKSPPHTGRVQVLAELFPDAKFIHLTRDPRKLFSSTMRLWHSLEEVQALQSPMPEGALKEYVAECLQRMYTGFESARGQIAPNRITDIRYEDLVASPLESLRSIYNQLDLGDFDLVEPQLQSKLANHDSYRTNRHRIDDGLEREILAYWPDYTERYGYSQATTN